MRLAKPERPEGTIGQAGKELIGCFPIFESRLERPYRGSRCALPRRAPSSARERMPSLR